MNKLKCRNIHLAEKELIAIAEINGHAPATDIENSFGGQHWDCDHCECCLFESNLQTPKDWYVSHENLTPCGTETPVDPDDFVRHFKSTYGISLKIF